MIIQPNLRHITDIDYSLYYLITRGGTVADARRLDAQYNTQLTCCSQRPTVLLHNQGLTTLQLCKKLGNAKTTTENNTKTGKPYLVNN